MNVTARQYSTAAEMRAAYADRRARLFGVRPVVPPAKSSIIVVTDWAARPMWKRFATHFDEHIEAWEAHKTKARITPAGSYIRDRCYELGIAVDEVLGPSRKRAVVPFRHLLMWEVRNRFDLSTVQIARVFGRDHTVIIYACQKMEAERGQG